MTEKILPEQDIRRRLSGAPYRGTFEAHVTTETPGSAAREQFRTLCRRLGVKCVVIELPDGVTRSQPMTASYHHGDLAAVLDEVHALAGNIRSAGFPVARLKLEAVATNDGVPETDDEAAAHPPINYFEYHAKLLLPADADLIRLADCCARRGARLSSNALKTQHDGGTERFVTARHYRVGRRTSFARFDALCDGLARDGYSVVHRLREYTVYDSRASLDAGWIETPLGAAG